MQCVILAGGLATRLRPVTATVPKAMIPVRGRPFADIQLAWLAAQGVTDVVYSIGYLGEQISEHVGGGCQFGLNVGYVDEGTELKGTAGALRVAHDQGVLEPHFGVLYGDSYLTFNVPAAMAAHRAAGLSALMTAYRNEGLYDTSNAKLSGGRVVRYDKRAADPVAEGLLWIDYGFSVIDRDAVLPLVPSGAVVDLGEIQADLSHRGELAAYEVTERFYEIGSPAGLMELEAHLQTIEGPE